MGTYHCASFFPKIALVKKNIHRKSNLISKYYYVVVCVSYLILLPHLKAHFKKFSNFQWFIFRWPGNLEAIENKWLRGKIKLCLTNITFANLYLAIISVWRKNHLLTEINAMTWNKHSQILDFYSKSFLLYDRDRWSYYYCAIGEICWCVWSGSR